MSELVCYCFGYTSEDIEQDVIQNGKSTIFERIMNEKKAGGCQCAEKNPKGRWCLSDVRQLADQILNKTSILQNFNKWFFYIRNYLYIEKISKIEEF